MKKHSQIQKFIPVLMISFILACLSCATNTMIISKSALPRPDYSKYYTYIVHGEQVKLLLGQPTISNDTLSGKIKQTYLDKSNDSGKEIHLYLSSDSVIKFDKTNEFLSVPLDGIEQVTLEEKKLKPFWPGFGTAAGVSIVIPAIFLLLYFLS